MCHLALIRIRQAFYICHDTSSCGGAVHEEEGLEIPLDLALVTQQGATALFSAFNAFYFLNRQWVPQRRRWGAMALVLVNLAFLVQSLYLGVLPSLLGVNAREVALDPRVRLVAGLLPFAAALVITVFILRHWLRRRKG